MYSYAYNTITVDDNILSMNNSLHLISFALSNGCFYRIAYELFSAVIILYLISKESTLIVVSIRALW